MAPSSPLRRPLSWARCPRIDRTPDRCWWSARTPATSSGAPPARWRCTRPAAGGGAGGGATVVALSYGERGESGDLWKEPGQTVENVKRVRQEECARAAAAIGAELVPFDLGDYPLEV